MRPVRTGAGIRCGTPASPSLLDGTLPDLWPLFGALAQVPLLLVHGGRSNLLLAETVARMRAARPDMAVATVPGSGHAPTLAEPEAVAAMEAFLG